MGDIYEQSPKPDGERLKQEDVIRLADAFSEGVAWGQDAWNLFGKKFLNLSPGEIQSVEENHSTRAKRVSNMFLRWHENQKERCTFQSTNAILVRAKRIATQQRWWCRYLDEENRDSFDEQQDELRKFIEELVDVPISEPEWTKLIKKLDVSKEVDNVSTAHPHNKMKQRQTLLEIWMERHGYKLAISDLKDVLKKNKLRRVICQIAGGSSELHQQFEHLLEDEWDHIFDHITPDQKQKLFNEFSSLHENAQEDEKVDDSFKNVILKGNIGFHKFIETLADMKVDLHRLFSHSKYRSVFTMKRLHPKAPHFKETEAYQKMKTTLADKRFVVLQGLPGCGKSQCAAAYAEEFKVKHPTAVVWFFECKNDEDSFSALRQSVIDAKICTNGYTTTNNIRRQISILIADIKNSSIAVLLVFEDLYKAIKADSILQDLIKELTEYDKAQIIATSRSVTPSAFTRQTIRGFTKKEALNFLEPKDHDEEKIAAQSVAELYSYLPLGLAPAKAYCAEQNLSYKKYLLAMQQETEALKLIKEFEDEWIKDFYHASENETGRNILATMILALSTLESVTLQSRTVNFQEIFSYAVYFHHENIPVYLFKQLMSHCNILSEDNAEPMSDLLCEIATNKLLKQLEDSSIGVVNRNQEDVYLSTVSTHRVVLFALKNKAMTSESKLIDALYALSCYFQKDNRLSHQHNQLLNLMPHVTKALSVDPVVKETKGIFRNMLEIRLLELKGFASTQTDAQVEAEEPLKEAHERMLKLLCSAGKIPVEELDATVEERILEGNGPDTFIETKARILYQFSKKAVDKIDPKIFSLLAQTVVLNREDIELLKRNCPPGKKLPDIPENAPITDTRLKMLREHKLALSEDNLKQLYLPEQLASILYTRGRLMFYDGFDIDSDRREEHIRYLKLSYYIARETAKDTAYFLLHFLISQTNGLLYLKLEKDAGMQDFQEAYKKYKGYLDSSRKFFEHGILKEDGKTTYNLMRCYRQMIKANQLQLECKSSTPAKEDRFEVCNKLKQLVTEHPEYAKTALRSLMVAGNFCGFGKKFELAIEFYRTILDRTKDEEEKYRNIVFEATSQFAKTALSDLRELESDSARKNCKEACERIEKARLLVPRQEKGETLQKLQNEIKECTDESAPKKSKIKE
ncbi:uncharacterized protein LOC143461281 isoform X2 [Clavelina lepadiformis]|uniref:Death domain-containing protein n=1 Tax=Clavelina lepadiformis TaxID=159417 RepID=A0ABP0F7X5_CLALP